MDTFNIANLYENVLKNDSFIYNLSPEAIKFGIECMAHVYKGTANLKSERSQVANYQDPAHRCAYLHKYAALHTAMVRDMLTEAIQNNFSVFRRLVYSGEQFKLCSLGGGPGTDVIGALAALHNCFSYFDASATIIDYMPEWSYSFSSILCELGSGMYGAFGNNVSHFLNWRYVGANLLKKFKPDVIQALSTADLVTMIKFTSAAACIDTRNMIRNIFTAMKPGAVLLFIDNDGGGFHQLMQDACTEFAFISIFGPLRRENYAIEYLRVKRFSYASCAKTTVSVHVLQKPFTPWDNFPNQQYTNIHIESPLLASPLTPFLYMGQNPDEDNNNNYAPTLYRNIQNSNAFSELDNSGNFLPRRQPSLRGLSPYTPSEHINQLNLPYNNDFTQGETVPRNPRFISPVDDIPQSGRALMPSHVGTPLSPHIISPPPAHFSEVYTPEPRGGRRVRMQGCFPLRINNFRHHLAQKINNVKARAKKIFRKKSKKAAINPKTLFPKL